MMSERAPSAQPAGCALEWAQPTPVSAESEHQSSHRSWMSFSLGAKRLNATTPPYVIQRQASTCTFEGLTATQARSSSVSQFLFRSFDAALADLWSGKQVEKEQRRSRIQTACLRVVVWAQVRLSMLYFLALCLEQRRKAAVFTAGLTTFGGA